MDFKGLLKKSYIKAILTNKLTYDMIQLETMSLSELIKDKFKRNEHFFLLIVLNKISY